MVRKQANSLTDMKKKRTLSAVLKKRKPAPKSAAAQDKPGYRTVRPRPLRYDEKVRILWPGDPELEKIDGGAFAQFLRDTQKSAEDEDDAVQAAGPSKRRVSMNKAAGSRKRPSSAASESVGGTPGPKIEVPRFRLLPKREWPEQPASLAAAARGCLQGEAAYIRLRGQTQDEIDSKVDYDLDSDDEEWLDHRNEKGVGGTLSKDDLERLIDGFEKAKHRILELKQTEWKRRATHKAMGKIDPAVLYTASNAIQDFSEAFPSLTVRAVHNYWAKKAAASKLPLLQRFWYDKPWARLVDLAGRHEETSSSEDEGAIPFQGKDSPKAAHHRKRTLELEEVHDRLNIARIDLERLRTIADQVQRREKMKKRDLLEWRTLWRQKLAVVGIPKVKVMKKVGRPTSPKTAKPANGKGKAEKVTLPKAKPAKFAGLGVASRPKKQPVKATIVVDLVAQLRKGKTQRGPTTKPPAARKKQPDTTAEVLPVHPASPPLTRHQEQALIDEAIQVSLMDGGGIGGGGAAGETTSRPTSAAAAKRVKFAGLNSFGEGPPGQSKGVTIGEAAANPKKVSHPAAKAVVQGSQPGKNRGSKPTKQPGASSKKRPATQPLEGRTRSNQRSGVALSAEEAAKPSAAKRPPAVILEGTDRKGGGPPAGFSLRAGASGKRKGSVEWLTDCQHGVVKLCNVPCLVDFFEEHSKCRPQWKMFARQKKETTGSYADRLAAAFPFTKAETTRRGWTATAQQPRPPPPQKARRGPPNRELASLMAAEQSLAGPRSRVRKSLAPQGDDHARDGGTKRRSSAEASSEPDDKPPTKRTAKSLSSSREQSSVPDDPQEAGRRTRGRDFEKAAHPQPREALGRNAGRVEAEERASPSERSSEESLSGSDTIVPADCDLEESSSDPGEQAFHGRRPQARLTRNNKVNVSIPKPRKPLEWGSWRNQNQADASDESCISEGSCPSLFSDPQPPKPTATGLRRWSQRQPHRPAARGVAKNIVAAARQRVKKLEKQA